MREIEPQTIGRHKAALLRHMLAKMVAQGLVQQMGGTVIGAQRSAPMAIHGQMNTVADRHRTGPDFDLVGMQPSERLSGVGDHGLEAIGTGNLAGVAHLATAFAVEGCLVGQQGDVITAAGGFDFLAVLDQRDDDALALLRCIAGKFGAAFALGNVEPHGIGSLVARAFPGRAGSRFLLGHRLVEPFAVDAQRLGAQRVLGQVIGEAECIVELERGFAGQDIAFAHVGDLGIEQLQAIGQRLPEIGFLAQQRFLDQRLGPDQFGKGIAHLAGQRADHPVHQRIRGPQQMGMAHRAAHDPAQHIATAFIGWQDAIGDQKGRSAQMIGYHPVAGLVVACCGGAGKRAGFGDQRLEQVDVVIVVHALHDRGNSFQPHAGVDRGFRQVDAIALAPLVILHEHQVPDLDKAVAILVRAARRAAGDMGAVIVEYLAARTAGPGIAHRPEIVAGRDPDDPFLGQASNFLPQIKGFVIGMENGHGQPVRRYAPGLGDQGPGMDDRLFLEIVAKGEIAQHLEEGMMPCGIADIVEIIVLAAGADAFLARRRRGIAALLDAGEDILERDHARIDEH